MKFMTNACCPKCDKIMNLSKLPQYSFECDYCDEDFFTMEVKECAGDLFEITVIPPANVYSTFYETHEEELQSITDEFGAVFLGYDDTAGYIDIGFEEIPSSDELQKMIAKIQQIK